MHYFRNNLFLPRFSCSLEILKYFFILSPFYSFSVYANSDSPIGRGLGYIIYDILDSGTGVALATLSLMGIGLACKFGYLEWKRLGQAVVGIAIIFGSEFFVTSIIGLVD
jgi:type IV secretory pathway VirB2 component (pilin)